MSAGDRWDQLIGEGTKTARQDRMDLMLYAVASKLINDQPIDERVTLALAESLLRISDGADPREVFGPLKGKRQSPKERSENKHRETVMARQVHYLVESVEHARGSVSKAVDFVAGLHHRDRRVVEAARSKHNESVIRLWHALQVLDEPLDAYLSKDDLPNLHEFLKKFPR